MKFQFSKKIGEVVYVFYGDAENVKEFFKQASFFSALPSVGPNGETDLTVSFRTTKEGHEYYSIICESAGQEFKLGQSKDNVTLFEKGWGPLYRSEDYSNESPGVAPPSQGIGSTPKSPLPSTDIAEDSPTKNISNPENSDSTVEDILSTYGIGGQ